MTRLARIDFDAVAPLMPFDKTAAQVASKGVHFEWTPADQRKLHSSEPIRSRAPNAEELLKPSFIDLTGKKAGRFTVTGIAADIKTTNGQNWVVRCVCGSFETRKARTIKSYLAGTNEDTNPMCESCRYTQRLQQGYHNEKKAAAAAEAIQEAAR